MSAKRLWLSCVFALLAASAAWQPHGKAAPQEVTLKLAAPVPKQGPYGRLLESAVGRILELTTQDDEPVRIQVYYGSAESRLADDLRVGNTQMALLTDVQLARIDRSAAKLRIPGTMHSWAEADTVREALRPGLNTAFQRQGCRLLAMIDIGRVLLATTAQAITTPKQLATSGLAIFGGDFITRETVGPDVISYTQVNNNVEVLAGLSSNSIRAVFASPLLAEQQMWTSYLRYALDGVPFWYAHAGLTTTSNVWLSLSETQRDTIAQEFEALEASSLSSIRQQDELAMGRMRARGGVHTATSAELSLWDKQFQDARERLKKYW